MKTVDLDGNVDDEGRAAGRASRAASVGCPTDELLIVSMLDRTLLRLEERRARRARRPQRRRRVPLQRHGRRRARPCVRRQLRVRPRRRRPPRAGSSQVLRDHPLAAMAIVSPDGVVGVAATGLDFPNGSVITPDGRTLIVAETLGQRLTAFTIADDGTLGDRRVFADLPRRAPDGICLDAEGAVWFADAMTNECVRVAEGGQVLEVVADRPDRATRACSAGRDGRPLFMLTAAVVGVSGRRDARSGHVQVTTVDVAARRAALSRCDRSRRAARPTRTGPGRRHGTIARPAAPRDLGDVPVAERVRLGRQQHEVGCERRDVVERRRSGTSPGGRRARCVTPRWASSDEPYVSPLIVIHGRRQIGTNAADVHGSARVPEVEPVARRRRRRDASAASSAATSASVVTCITWTCEPGGRQCLGVLAPVLLPVDHHEVGRERDDRGDVGILGPADVDEGRLLAEPRARDDVDAPRQQRLGRRRHQADDPHRRRWRSAVEEAALLRLELLGRQGAALHHRPRAARAARRRSLVDAVPGAGVRTRHGAAARPSICAWIRRCTRSGWRMSV